LGAVVAIPPTELNILLADLRKSGYSTIGPSVREETLVYNEVQGLDDLPRGYSSKEDSGKYQLVYSGHPRYFDITPGPHTWKQYLFPSRSELYTFRKDATGWSIEEDRSRPKYAFVGVRPCELKAIQIQDKVFIRPYWSDPVYRLRRQSAFIIIVNCLHPGGTCFCDSLGTGPEAIDGYDLSLTELEDVFLVKIGSEAGRLALNELAWEPATAFWQQAARSGLDEARHRMGRSLPDPASLPEYLLANLEHPAWDEVGERCLGCANCTQVCPTCFCWEVKDSSDLSGETCRRERFWDSCFNPDYSYVFGGNTRPNIRARYRQWLTHKLASWQTQFETLGCVGCGRCITWCPAGIDLTATVAALRGATMRSENH
jgi:ferredoxin